ncbi:hypothetical protein Tco_0575828 [Tanacetum coccineum]
MATIKNLTFPAASGNGAQISIPYLWNGHEEVMDVSFVFGIQGAVRFESSAICFFIYFKALSASSIQVKSLFLKHHFEILKNGIDFSAAFDKNLFRLASFPFRLCTSFNVLGEGMLVMAWAFHHKPGSRPCLRLFNIPYGLLLAVTFDDHVIHTNFQISLNLPVEGLVHQPLDTSSDQKPEDSLMEKLNKKSIENADVLSTESEKGVAIAALKMSYRKLTGN